MTDMPNYLQVARELQGRLRDRTASESDTKWRELLEFAAAEFHVQRGKFVQSRKRGKTPRREEDERSVEGEEQVCRHACYEHELVMNPDRWGTLPRELLHLLFSHLPVNKILDLQCLSKDWKESLGARGECDFLRACDEAHPKMFALISKVNEREGPGNLFLIRVFDTKLNEWRAFQFSTGVPERDWPLKHLQPQWRHMSCEDGGLLLFDLEAHRVPKRKESFRSFFFKVMNPLTGYELDLPPILDVQHVQLKCIIVDRETNRYKVLITVKRGCITTDDILDDIQVFHPETGRWSEPSEARNIMFGNLSAYDFVMGRLGEHGIEQSPWYKDKVLSFAFLGNYLGNHLFVLVKDTNAPRAVVPTNRPRETYRIKEYIVGYHPQQQTTFLEVDVHKFPFENTPKSNNNYKLILLAFENTPKSNNNYKLILLASNGFLVVFVTLTELKPWQSDKGWLYDLSSRTWRDLPKLPGDEYLWLEKNSACEIRWNAHP